MVIVLDLTQMVRVCRGKMWEEAPRSLAHNEATLYTVFKLLVIISSESFSHQVDMWSQGCLCLGHLCVRCVETCTHSAECGRRYGVGLWGLQENSLVSFLEPDFVK